MSQMNEKQKFAKYHPHTHWLKVFLFTGVTYHANYLEPEDVWMNLQ